MKPPSQKVYQLIKAMTPAEKRFFRRQAERHTLGEINQYLVLFDAIEAQEQYDEETLRQTLGANGIAGYLAVGKRYLMEQLLDSLHLFHRVTSTEEQLKRDLHAAGILLEKGLIAEAGRRLVRMKQTAHHYQFHYLLPELLTLERTWMERTFYHNKGEAALQTWRQEWETALQALSDEGYQAWVGSRVARLHYQKVAVNDEALQEEFRTLLIPHLPPQASLRAQLDRLKAQSTWFFMNGRFEDAYQCNQQLLALMETHPFLIELNPKRYLVTLNNFLIDNHQLKKYEVLEEGLLKLKSLPQRREFKRLPQLDIKIFELSAILELNSRVFRRQFTTALSELPAIQAGLENHGEKVAFHYRLTLFYLMAYVYFSTGNFNEALTWLNRLLQQPRRNVVEELFRFGNLLNLLTHYELGNYDLLESLIQAVRRQHSQMGRLFHTEVILLAHLRKLINAADSRRQKDLMWSLLAQMKQARLQPSEQRVFNYFEYVEWLEGKLF